MNIRACLENVQLLRIIRERVDFDHRFEYNNDSEAYRT